MCFIRFAGCNVGRPYTDAARETLGLQGYQDMCRDWAGTAFPCDTNYRKHAEMTVDEIMNYPEVAKAFRVCITGGEPMLYPLRPLAQALYNAGKKIHVETSGTLDVGKVMSLGYRAPSVWLTVSPKHGYRMDVVYLADEVKVLVSQDFNEARFKVFATQMDEGKVWLQPVNEENQLNHDNIRKCLELQAKYPKCRLSLQLHKIIGVR